MSSTLRVALAIMTVFSIAAPITAQTVSAGPMTHPTTGNRYYLLSTPSWEAAEAWAVARGGHLATISSAAENDWVRDMVLNTGGQQRKAYLGLSDTQVNGTWTWISGQAVSFTNWGPGEPGNGSAMDFAVMFSDGKWHARSQTEQSLAIVEIAGPIRVPQELSSIQGAINAAIAGETILVSPGVYYEHPVIPNKRLIVRGVAGAESTIIDAQHTGRGFIVDQSGAAGSVIEGLTIRNGQHLISAGLLIIPANVVVRDCIFHGNIAEFYGGAIYSAENVTITNCLMYDNQSANGAGVHIEVTSAPSFITNCTIVNSYEFYGHAIYANYAFVNVRNSILRCQPVNLGGITTINVAYCNTITPVAGPGNISVDPQFGPGYRLSAGSPCIDAGTNDEFAFSGFGAALDCGGKGRFIDDPSRPDSGNGPGPVIDMGAFEFQPLPMTIGDMNGDGIVNGLDVAPFVTLLIP